MAVTLDEIAARLDRLERLLTKAVLGVAPAAGGDRPVDALISIAKVDRDAAILAARELFKQQTKGRRSSHA